MQGNFQVGSIRCLLAAIALVAVWGGAPGAAIAASGPRVVVEAFHADLISVMKQAKALKTRGRFDFLLPRIQKAFDLPLMMRLAAGSNWRHANAADRAGMIAAFTRMSAGIYASRFDGYSGQKFVTVGERKGPRGTMLVETQIRSPGDKPVTLTYVTRANKGEWRIVDVLLGGGISELAVRRSEYHRVLATRGAAGLIGELDRASARLLR